ncbi:MAG TPA: sulfite exporter TauE/SafE family protein [Chitinophagaceae bacterium]|nr:sulfite exporter TauE/SafE family protein [Chitinophagaceae bacterium]
MATFIGYTLATLIGISLGIIGAGGSILTVPILVYVIGLDAVTATGYSLFIVGASSLSGAIESYFKKQIDLKTALLFGLPSIGAALTVRRWLLPLIPDPLFTAGSFQFTKHIFLLVVFAMVMVAASVSMIRPQKQGPTGPRSNNLVSVLLSGLAVGILTGLVGAGGGFLIIPALVLLLHLPIKKAIGTSLLIITMNTLASFAGAIGSMNIHWNFLLLFSAFAIGGMLIGIGLRTRIAGEKLKPAFGWFVLAMGIYILVRELLYT